MVLPGDRVETIGSRQNAADRLFHRGPAPSFRPFRGNCKLSREEMESDMREGPTHLTCVEALPLAGRYVSAPQQADQKYRGAHDAYPVRYAVINDKSGQRLEAPSARVPPRTPRVLNYL